MSPSARRGLLRLGTPLLIAVVLGLFGVGRFSGLSSWFADDLEAPTTILGQPRATGTEAVELESRFASTVSTVDRVDALIAFYGRDATPYSGLLVVRPGVGGIDGVLDDTDLAGVPREQRSSSTCASSPVMTMCGRSTDSLTVLISSSGPADAIAAEVDRVWDAN